MDSARALIGRGNTAEAVALLELIRDRSDTPPDALGLLGALYLELARPEDAAKVLAPLVENPDADPRVLYDAAQAALAQGNGEEARVLLKRSIEKSPATQASLLLAHLHASEDRHDLVVELLVPIVDEERFAQLAESDPLAADLTLRSARSLLALGRSERAVEQLRRVARFYAENSEVFQMLGQALTDLGRLDEARAALSRARELKERERAAVIQRQEAKLESERRAQELLAAASQEYRAARKDSALGLLSEALSLAPEHLVARSLEIRLLLELDRADDAFLRAEELVALDPGAESLHLRGLAQLGRDGHAAAEADFRRALEAKADHLAARNGLALALVEQRRTAEAREVLEETLARWPDDAVARLMLARLSASSVR